MYGNVGVDDKITGDDVVYLYPDFLTAIKVQLFLDSQTNDIHSCAFFREFSGMKDSCRESG